MVQFKPELVVQFKPKWWYSSNRNSGTVGTEIFTAAGTDLKDRYIMNVEHGAAGRRQITKLTVYLDKVLIE